MKTCFKCNLSLPRSEFYPHPQMGDGLLGKCKTCTKRDTAERIARVSQNPEWLAKERARCREKAERARRSSGIPKRPEANRPLTQKKWRIANPHKRKAQHAANNAVRCGKLIPRTNCEDCGVVAKLQKHHEDYSKPLSVEWLCTKCHGRRHWKEIPLDNLGRGVPLTA